MAQRRYLLAALPAVLLAAFVLPADPPSPQGRPLVPQAAPDGPAILALDLRDDPSDADVAALQERHGIELSWSSPWSRDEGLMRATVDDGDDLAAALARDPRVELVEEVRRFELLAVPDDPLWPQQWNMRMIGAPAGWAVGGGRGVTVAVIDSGISPVEDLAGVRLAPGRSFVPGAATAADDVGHGTHVAGTIAQATNNGLGVAGIAPNVTLVPYKVIGAGGFGSSDAVAAAIDEAVDDGADVINLSLGGPDSSIVHKAVQQALDRGVIVVAAVGNTGRSGVSCPANHDGVLGLSAVGPEGRLAPYSSWGPGTELAAPGGDLRQDGGGILQDTVEGSQDVYRAWQGTSMAAPHVSGAAAVLLGTGLGARATVDALRASARKGTDPRLGHGTLDLAAALRGQTERRSWLGFLAGLLALLLGRLVGPRLKILVALVLLAASLAAGLFFLVWMGGPAALGVEALAVPAALGAPDAVHHPVWASAALPWLLTFFLGPHRSLWWIPAAVGCAWAVSLAWAAGSGSLDPWGPTPDPGWLLANAVMALGAAMAAAGTEAVRRQR